MNDPIPPDHGEPERELSWGSGSNTYTDEEWENRPPMTEHVNRTMPIRYRLLLGGACIADGLGYLVFGARKPYAAGLAATKRLARWRWAHREEH